MHGIGTGSVNLSEITTYLFDLDGVLWRGDTAIEGAVAAVKKLRDAGKRCLFCTNNSTHTTEYYVEKLEGIGLRVKENDVLTSSWVTAHYLSGHFTGSFLAYVIGEEGICTSLQKIGARIVPDSDLDSIKDVDCVVVGLDRDINYTKLHHAQRLIQSGALFIATNRDGSYPMENGVSPGAGAIVAAVETASGVTPVTVGKPRSIMVDLAIERLNLKQSEVALVGDRLDTDITCARRAGITAICVLTGVTSEDKAMRARGELRPHYIYATLTDLCKEALTKAPTITDEPTEAPVEVTETPAVSPIESAFTLPADDALESEEGTAEEISSVLDDDIDQLFEDQQEQNSGEEEVTFDLDTALSVTEEKEPELPASQQPSSAVDTEIDSAETNTLDLDTAMSVVPDEQAPPPERKEDAKKDTTDESGFEWKLD